MSDYPVLVGCGTFQCTIMLKEVTTFIVYEICVILGYYALYSSNSLLTTGTSVIESNGLFEAPCCLVYVPQYLKISINLHLNNIFSQDKCALFY